MEREAQWQEKNGLHYDYVVSISGEEDASFLRLPTSVMAAWSAYSSYDRSPVLVNAMNVTTLCPRTVARPQNMANVKVAQIRAHLGLGESEHDKEWYRTRVRTPFIFI